MSSFSSSYKLKPSKLGIQGLPDNTEPVYKTSDPTSKAGFGSYDAVPIGLNTLSSTTPSPTPSPATPAPEETAPTTPTPTPTPTPQETAPTPTPTPTPTTPDPTQNIPNLYTNIGEPDIKGMWQDLMTQHGGSLQSALASVDQRAAGEGRRAAEINAMAGGGLGGGFAGLMQQSNLSGRQMELDARTQHSRQGIELRQTMLQDLFRQAESARDRTSMEKIQNMMAETEYVKALIESGVTPEAIPKYVELFGGGTGNMASRDDSSSNMDQGYPNYGQPRREGEVYTNDRGEPRIADGRGGSRPIITAQDRGIYTPPDPNVEDPTEATDQYGRKISK
jgi:hypothetical protein